MIRHYRQSIDEHAKSIAHLSLSQQKTQANTAIGNFGTPILRIKTDSGDLHSQVTTKKWIPQAMRTAGYVPDVVELSQPYMNMSRSYTVRNGYHSVIGDGIGKFLLGMFNCKCLVLSWPIHSVTQLGVCSWASMRWLDCQSIAERTDFLKNNVSHCIMTQDSIVWVPFGHTVAIIALDIAGDKETPEHDVYHFYAVQNLPSAALAQKLEGKALTAMQTDLLASHKDPDWSEVYTAKPHLSFFPAHIGWLGSLCRSSEALSPGKAEAAERLAITQGEGTPQAADTGDGSQESTQKKPEENDAEATAKESPEGTGQEVSQPLTETDGSKGRRGVKRRKSAASDATEAASLNDID